MAQIVFETFKCPAWYVCTQSVLSLYASGCITGIVLNSGNEVTHVVPVYEGYVIPSAISRLDFGGDTLTKYFYNLISETLWENSIHLDKDTPTQMKERVCFVAENFEDSLRDPSSDLNIEYKLPDGKTIGIGKERLQCPELLFRPKLHNVEEIGFHEGIHKSIEMCDADVRQDMLTHIVLAGGNTMFEGLSRRLDIELGAMDPTYKSQAKLTASPEKQFLTWIGGSILASLPSFQSMWISKDEYEESGPSIINRKCL